MPTLAFKISVKTGDKVKQCTVISKEPVTNTAFREEMDARFGAGRVLSCMRKSNKTEVVDNGKLKKY